MSETSKEQEATNKTIFNNFNDIKGTLIRIEKSQNEFKLEVTRELATIESNLSHKDADVQSIRTDMITHNNRIKAIEETQAQQAGMLKVVKIVLLPAIGTIILGIVNSLIERFAE